MKRKPFISVWLADCGYGDARAASACDDEPTQAEANDQFCDRRAELPGRAA